MNEHIYNVTPSQLKQLSWALSTKPYPSVQITSAMGCPVGCEYCPQSTLSENRAGRKHSLEAVDFEKYLQNIPLDTLLRWTGYSEPILAKEFPEMVSCAHKKGYKQLISTTLVGPRRCLDFLEVFPGFIHFNFHLQDMDNKMPGLIVNGKYIDTFKRIFTAQLKRARLNPLKITIQCWGRAFHPLISKAIDECASECSYSNEEIEQMTRISDLLSSRSGKANVSAFRRKALKKYSQNDLSYIYFCGKKSLSNPVLLPNGELNICCDNYSLEGIKGSLSDSNLVDVQGSWFEENWYKFATGKMSPCTECEHYRGTLLLKPDEV